MKEKILENLNYFLEYVKQGTDFIKDQAPLYVQEIVQYHMVLYLSYNIICFFIIGVSILLLQKGTKIVKKNQYDEFGFALIVAGVIGVVIPFFINIYNMTMFIKTVIAPRVFVMDYLIHLIKYNL